MAVKIGRAFDDLTLKAKEFKQTITDNQKEIKKLDRELKINPGNVDAVRQKFALLEKNLQTNAERISAFKKQQEILNDSFDKGKISESDYNKQLASLRSQLKQAEQAEKDLTDAINEKNSAIRAAKFDNVINGLDKAKEKAEAFSKVALGIVGALTAIVTAAVKTGDELSDNATHFGTTVENLQIWSNRLGMLAKDQEAYTASLQKIGAIQSSITAGRGARYLTYLKELGLTQEDVLGKSNGEVFDTIYAKLREVTDETQRAVIAQGLLGDTGLEIAVIAGTVQSEIDNLDSALIENGIITTDQAKAADETANKFLALKQQFQANSAELLVALMPAIEALTNFLKTAVIPIIDVASQWLGNLGAGGQRILLVVLMLIIVLPKILALVKMGVTIFKTLKAATLAQAAATTTLNAVSTPWLGIIMAISAALMLLISLISIFTGKAYDATDMSNELMASMGETESMLKGMGADLELGGDVSYETNNHKTYDFNLDVTATGDTPISQENADYIAENLENKMRMDFINNELGGVVR